MVDIDDLVGEFPDEIFGKDLEKTVLAEAIWLEIQHKILVYGNKTIVFE